MFTMQTNSYFISNRANHDWHNNKDVVQFQKISCTQGPPGLCPRKDLQGGLGGLGGPGGPGLRKYLLGSQGSLREHKVLVQERTYREVQVFWEFHEV
jgi:hypothetical protein